MAAKFPCVCNKLSSGTCTVDGLRSGLNRVYSSRVLTFIASGREFNRPSCCALVRRKLIEEVEGTSVGSLGFVITVMSVSRPIHVDLFSPARLDASKRSKLGHKFQRCAHAKYVLAPLRTFRGGRLSQTNQ